MGQAAEQLGHEGAQAAQTWDLIHATVDEANAKKSFNDYIRHSDDVLHSGADAFYAKAGKGALDDRETTVKSLEDKKAELLKGAVTERERTMLSDALDRRLEDDLKGVGSFSIQQAAKYNIDESESRVALSSNDATANAFNPEVSEKSITTGLSELDHLASVKGWGPDELKTKKIIYTSGTRKDIALRFIYENDGGPDVAEKYLDAHTADFTADDITSVETHIRTQRNAMEVERRRDAAEQRRLDREAKSDAGDRAEEVLRIADTGTPLPAKTIADALEDARTADKPGLAFRLGQASFKNDLTVLWRAKSPAQIQGHLNELGAKIAAAGENADAKDITEFDHLTNVRNQSARDLNQDPLSWGASHLGMNIPALNWNNQQSIQERTRIAQRIHERTGAPVRVLTNEEASAYAPLAADGTIAQRRAIVDRLAQFGPLAGAAAQQVAPNDTKLVGMVGLATVSNRAVARSLVTDALTGVEVLKANPKLIDRDKAARLFQEHVGGAFQLLPQTAQGVMANAQAMFAADADRNGITDWGHGQKRWTQAIDRALGAYMDGGVKHGGIGEHNGSQIILPEDMSQQGFDLKVARATKDQIMRASNGVPTWANGKALIVNEFKAMHFVTVGNGRYRLTDGANFVSKRGGGFYEVDINRLGGR